MIERSGILKAVVGCVLMLMPVIAFGERQRGDSGQTTAAEGVDHHVREGKALFSLHVSETFVAQDQSSSGISLSPVSGAGGPDKPSDQWFVGRLFNAYVDEFKGTTPVGKELPRRALASPWEAPPFPMSEYQGNPLIGVPISTKEYPLMRALYGGPLGEMLKESRIRTYGWVNGSYNWSTNKNSNMPTSYWIAPDSVMLNQALFRVEREVDTVQTDHIDFGFRATVMYGYDYRYMTAGGWFDSQLHKRNQRYGIDPTELYADMYIPWVAQGLLLRVGRWVATPDIETQFAPDNYLGTHSILFTHDTYTQTGAMATVMLNQQWSVQGGVHAGTDMAPWYRGAVPTGMVGVRWVGLDNNDSLYVVLNSINNANYQDFELDGQPAGHTNFNIVNATWQHRFTSKIHTKTEGYYMWEKDAPVGGTVIIGPARSFGGGGGKGALIPGMSKAYGIVNYTAVAVSRRDYITIRNEWWRDETGFRSGFAGHYSSHTLGLSHQFNDVVMIRPEIGYYRNYDRAAFDLGTERDMVMVGVDTTLRF